MTDYANMQLGSTYFPPDSSSAQLEASDQKPDDFDRDESPETDTAVYRRG